jgi:hypothetical protein
MEPAIFIHVLAIPHAMSIAQEGTAQREEMTQLVRAKVGTGFLVPAIVPPIYMKHVFGYICNGEISG